MKKTLRINIVLRLSGWLLLILVVSACKWNLDTQSFQTCASPTAQINSQAAFLAVTYSLSALTGTTDDVKWDFGDGQSASTTATVTTPHTYTAAGTYTVKATLTNKCGDSYTATKSVTVSNVVVPTVTIQDPTTIVVTGATLPMTVTNNGNGTISRYGLCYSTTNNPPTISDSTVNGSAPSVAGVATSLSVAGLKANTLYYVRAFATNTAGTGYSTAVKSFTTASVSPIVTAVSTTSFDKNTATVLFRLDNTGNPAATRYGICYSATVATPELSNSSAVDVPTPTVSVNTPVSLTNLAANTTYYYRAFAVYANGIVYGSTTLSFKTLTNVDLASGLILDMPFDGNATDFSGNANNGALLNGATFTTSRKGTANSALSLDGVNDYVEIPDNTTLRPASISVSIWIKPTAAATGNRMQIFIKNQFSDGENEQYSAIVKEIPQGSSATRPYTNFDIKQQSNCVQSQGWQDFELADLILTNTWQHLVFVYEGTTMKEYHNNVLIQTKSTSTSQTFMDNCPGGTLKFGAQSQKFPNYFQGAMDDVRIYNRALTDAQVDALYKQ